MDTLGYYIRGPHFAFNSIVYFFYIIYAAWIAIWAGTKERDAEKKKNCLFIGSFMLLPALGTVIQVKFYGLSLIFPFVILSLLMVYLNVQQRQMAEQNQRVAEKEK